MMINMEQETNVKDEIVGTLAFVFRSIKDDIIKEIDIRFGVAREEADVRFHAITEGINERFQEQGILLEKMQDDIGTLVDGQEILHENVDRLDQRVVAVETRLHCVEI
jgi:hypothetical protein